MSGSGTRAMPARTGTAPWDGEEEEGGTAQMFPPGCSPAPLQRLRLLQGETEAQSSMEHKSWCFLGGKTFRGMGTTKTFIPSLPPPRRDAGEKLVTVTPLSEPS